MKSTSLLWIVAFAVSLCASACSSGGASGAGGASSSSSGSGGDPFAAPAQCTSMQQLPPSQEESEKMNPGHACNACHQDQNSSMGADAPLFAVVGTVFPSAHEPDDCLAPAAQGAQVEITDAMGKKIVMTANEVGNFFPDPPDTVIAYPYKAKVIFEGRERAMIAAQTDGDCNGCHTQSGAESAPGRILLP